MEWSFIIKLLPYNINQVIAQVVSQLLHIYSKLSV